MINRLLVANRGEIARRVFRSCRDAGISTAAVYSAADADSLHVREADVAVALPGNAAADTYLRVDLLIAAAQAAGADAVHPGYGFLSEQAGFAQAVLDAGLVWVGPPPEAIEAMGSKLGAKKLMADAGVPVLGETDVYPVIIKASAGGGGRGMRIVRSADELEAQLALARAEAEAAFGDPTVFTEPYIEVGRHIEVQILADTHGTVWALGERECSIQRRHQKVLEESPSPNVDAELRAKLCDAAVAAARAIGYVGAGTVEFLVAPDGRFFFLEMNTRLQVEHPVTECVYGLDLVDWQLRIAEGAQLPADLPQVNGHAIEVRLYAEDPALDWRPQSGTLYAFDLPGIQAEFRVPNGYGIRLDSAVTSGSRVSVFYDPMLAKVIAWGPTRDAAARRLAAALAGARLRGLTTNRDLLVSLLRHPSFQDGDTDTAFLTRHDLTAPLASPETVRLSAVAAALAQAAANRAHATVLKGLPSGWRNLHSQPQRRVYQEAEITYRFGRDGVTVTGFDDLKLVSATPDEVVLELAGVRRAFAVESTADGVYVDSPLGSVTLHPVERFAPAAAELAQGSLVAPMPGTVARVAVSVGDSVTQGQPLLWIEAMKMQHELVAPISGTVGAIHVQPGAQVELNTTVITIEESA